MKSIIFLNIIFIFNCLLNAGNINSTIFSSSSPNIKQDEAIIEKLLDGNYRYCSDPNPYPEDEPDVHRYCFTFTKTGMEVVGNYLYRAPKDTSYICIEGIIKNNLITGVGYEGIGPGSRPYTEEEFSNLEELSSSEQLRYWDDVEHYQGGLNLKVGNSSWYKLSPVIENKHELYWVTQRYEIVKFDLSNFEQIEVDGLAEFAKCIN